MFNFKLASYANKKDSAENERTLSSRVENVVHCYNILTKKSVIVLIQKGHIFNNKLAGFNKGQGSSKDSTKIPPKVENSTRQQSII